MKRVLMGVAAGAIVVGGVFATSAAFAGPSNQASVTLSCDRNVTATVAFALTSTDGADAGKASANCGPSTGHIRFVVDAEAAADLVTVTTFNVSASGGAANSCVQADSYPVPARIDCSADGRAGARLVVR